MSKHKVKDKKLIFFSIFMTLVVAILVAVLLILFANEYKEEVLKNIILTQAATVIISVACSIIASLMWARIDKEQSQNINSIVEQINAVEKVKFAPVKIYTGTNVIHDEFNKNLNKKIEGAQKYSYMGDKARFLAKRLDKDITRTNAKLVIEVFLPDIKDDSLFLSRLEQLRRQERHYSGNKSKEDLIVDEKMDVIKSIYLLKKLEDRYDLKIFLHKEIPAYRLEIVDNTLVVSLITTLIDGNYYPITLVYENEQQLQEFYLDYLEEVKNRSQCLTMDTLTMEYLVDMGKRYIKREFTSKEFEDSELIEGREK